jgi:transporter family protein
MTSQDLLSIFFLLATMILWGSTPLIEKLGLKDVDPLMGIFIRSLVITVILFVFYLFSGRLNELTKITVKKFSLFAASGIMAGLIGMWTYFYLLKEGMTSKIVPIAASYPLITAVLSIFVLGEQVTLQRIIGIVLTIVGIILVKQS